MNPFVLAGQVQQTLLDYLKTTFHLSDRAFERSLFHFLESRDGMFCGPYIDVRLPFRQSAPSTNLPLEVVPPFPPYAHQARAFERLSSRDGHIPQPTLVVTGTGSGKTECFLYPILDHCYRLKEHPGIKAILLYPMNALASDQARRLAKLLWNDPRLKGKITAGLYVGGIGTHQKPDSLHLVDARQELRKKPPDILLTNYKMLDFLLLRPEDSELWRHNLPDTLQYLVLDELHTYDGAQGSDVACLVRRLKARLGIARGGLCPVGTSATIHSSPGSRGSADSGMQLRRFAEIVFEEGFDENSLVGEDRLSLDEALGPPNLDIAFPAVSDLSQLQPEAFESAERYLAQQLALWFGSTELTPFELGERLKPHPFLHDLLRALGGRLLDLSQLGAEIARYSPDFAEAEPELQRLLIISFLSLVSHARADLERPFLTCQAQVWMRELRRLTYDLKENHFHWYEEDPTQNSPRLPLLYCNECGAHLLAAVQLEGQERVARDPRRIGASFKDRKLECRGIQILAEPTEDPQFLCPDCFRLGKEARCSCGESALPVRLSLDRREERKTFSARCPDCAAAGTLGFLASRAATLNSVTLHHLFNSDFNQDRKALAFSDSVQDASHGAGFVSSRTYRFSLRGAIQDAVQSTDAITLHQLAPEVLGRCEAAWGPARALVTLWPPDLVDDQDYQAFAEQPERVPSELRRRLLKRLDWECTSEFGFTSLVGRSLERSACSLVYPDDALLDQALNQLEMDFSNRLPVQGSDQVTRNHLRHFLLGLIYRIRTRGGVFHDFLGAYAKNNGQRYLLSKGFDAMMAPMPSGRLPVFLTDMPSEAFDWFGAPPARLTWYRDWAARSLGIDRQDQGMRELYLLTLNQLARVGLVDDRDGAKQGKVYGLRPQALIATSDVARLECARCGHTLHSPRVQLKLWEDAACLHFRCPGRYRQVVAQESYYARLYRRGLMERIFASEHTGLLSRGEREILEDRFKAGDRPDSPNLLMCTPTLEMGVDVGDLSAVLACTVPPATANYLQRIGRAGRQTGNALALTMAESRPHDLYFFAQPLEMMRGQVLPPGCFLDAPEMLQRQLVAFIMDQWARQATGFVIKREILPYLSPAGRREFPGRLLEFLRENRRQLLDQFCALFPGLEDVPLRQVRAFGESTAIVEKIEAAFESLAAEREQLLKLRNQCKRAIQELKDREEALRTDKTDEELKELEGSQKVLYRLIEELANKYPLNVLTDAGVLPNYAFPEPGVTLKTVVRGRDQGVQSRELMRPASAALRELAPNNHFYAHGQVVSINQVDLGTKQRPLLEEWRLCPACAYSVRLDSPSAKHDLCPACGNNEWSDTGQVQALVRMRHVSALADLLSSRTTDFSEDRESVFYQTVDLIAVGRENLSGQCWQLPSLPFGFELLRNLTLREINFGPGGDGPQLSVSGQKLPLRHFQTCRDCGRVEDENWRLNHAPYCPQRDGKKPENKVNLALYREMTSEAIRLLLPVATVDVETQLASFKAALMLGLRRHFQGNPLHLIIRRQSEPVDGNPLIRRQFLVLYDAVPGGTGYLAALSRPEGLFEVLRKANEALTGCSCNQDPDQDGCYRCLFAFQQQFELVHISRRQAVSLLNSILQGWGKLESGLTLSEVSLDDRLESELEHLFLARLLEEVERLPGGRHSQIFYGGRRCYQLQLSPNRRWLVIPQLELGFCRPDFVLRPDWGQEGERPIAVFCDGREFHVCPGRPTSRLADDFRKRSQILRQEKHWIWNVTWWDLESKASNLSELLHWLSGADSPPDAPTWKVMRDQAFKRAKNSLRDGSNWHQREASGLRECRQWLIRRSTPYAGSIARDASNHELFGHLSEKPHALQGVLWEPAGARTPTAETLQVLLRLYDNPGERSQSNFGDSWRWLLQQWNHVQFLPWHRVISTSLIEEDPDYVEWVAEPPVAYQISSPGGPWQALRAMAHSLALPVMEALEKAGAAPPEVGHEVTDDGGRVLGELELAWPSFKVGLTLAEEDPLPGWRTLALSEYAELLPLLTSREVEHA